MENREADMSKTPGQLATEKARAASIRSKKAAAARRHAAQWIEGLRLIGYTVIEPGNDETPSGQ